MFQNNEAKAVSIFDIRQNRTETSIREDMQKSLSLRKEEELSLPTMLLYDEKGLKLFEEITYLEEYYPTNTEIELLHKHAFDIAHHVQPGSKVIELGSGYCVPICNCHLRVRRYRCTKPLGIAVLI